MQACMPVFKRHSSAAHRRQCHSPANFEHVTPRFHPLTLQTSLLFCAASSALPLLRCTVDYLGIDSGQPSWKRPLVTQE